MRILLLLFCVLSTLVTSAEAKLPNVVMIISDDQAWTDYGFMGHEAIQTPNLDRLAKESLTFTRGYVPSSLCRPSLATLATGLFPHQHGITGNDPPMRNNREAMLKHIDAAHTLPEMLGEKGYLSHQSGKWWEGSFKRGGFTHGMTHGDPRRGGRHGDEGLKIGRTGMQPVFDFVKEAGDQPFFLWYAPFLPHTPHNPPQRLLSKYQKPGRSEHVAKYWAMCEWFDETVGELLDFLDDQGLSENTLVVYVTDNGWIQRENAGSYAPRSKRSPNEGGIRTPIMLRWPGKIQPRMDEKTLVSSIDLVPTIRAAAGLEAASDLPGVNLLPLGAGGSLDRDVIFGEILEHDVADLDDPTASLLYRWCIQGDWKLILPTQGKSAELYDLSQDPHENNNLAAKEPQRVAALKGLIHDWWPAGD